MPENIPENIQEINEAMKSAARTAGQHFLRSQAEALYNLQAVYSGREILELLQNADDAYSEYLLENPNTQQENVEVLIEYNDVSLTISNKGKPFDIDRVHILCQGGFSNKEKVIGCKGKGFRSLLNFSDDITIYSGDLSFRFSRTYADSQCQEIRDSLRVREFLQRDGKYPILLAPESIAPIERNGWDTIIRINLLDEAEIRQEVERQLEEFNPITLLFLPNISKVRIHKNNDEIVYQKNRQDGNKFLLEKSVNGNSDDRYGTYYFFEEVKCVRQQNNNWEIVPDFQDTSLFQATRRTQAATNSKLLHNAIAIPERSKNFNNTPKLFSFFEIGREYSPFYATLHSSFDLTEDRNNLIDNDLNRLVGKTLLEFYVNSITNYFTPDTFGNYAVELLTPVNFDRDNAQISFITAFNLRDDYLSLFTPAFRILKSISGENLSKRDNPKYIEKDVNLNRLFPQPLWQVNEPSLLRTIVEFNSPTQHNPAVIAFFERAFNGRAFGEEQLKTEIRRIVRCGQLSSTDRVNIVHEWRRVFGGDSVKTLGILKNDQNAFINDNEKCFFRATITGTPEWANIQILGEEDETNLLNVFEIEIRQRRAPNRRRALKNLISISDQENLDQVFNDVNNSITERNQAIEFIRWLYGYYPRLRTETQEKIPGIVGLKIPTTDSYAPKEDVYLGNNYGNGLANTICTALDMKEVAPYTDFINDDFSWEMEDARIFFQDVLNVPTTPNLDKTEVVLDLDHDYLDYVTNEIGEPRNFGRWAENSKIQRVRNIQRLGNVRTKDLISWFFSDEEIKNSVMGNPVQSKLSYYPHRAGRAGLGTTAIHNVDIPSYMHWFFTRHRPWISINGGNKFPCDVLIDEVRREAWYQELAQEHSATEIEALLTNVGVRSDVLESSPEAFYTQILEQSQNNDRDAALKLYRKIADPSNNEKIQNIVNFMGYRYRQFLKEGRVLAVNNEGIEEFHPVRDTYYTSSAVLNFSNNFIMKTPSRQGKAEIFVGIFGVQEYREETITVDDYTEDAGNAAFNSELKNFIPYFLVLRGMTNERIITDLGNLNVTLARRISMTVNGERINQQLNPYTVVKQSPRNWFIYTANEGYNKDKIGEALKNIFYVVLNNPAEEQLVFCEYGFPKGEKHWKKKLGEKNYSVDEVAGIAQRVYNTVNYEELLREAFPDATFDEDTIHLIRTIDFHQSRRDSLKLVQLAQNIKKDIPEIAQAIGINLSIEQYNKEKLYRWTQTNESRIYHFLTQSLNNQSIEEKGELGEIVIQLKTELRNLNQETMPSLNSIDFDECDVLKEKLEDYGFNYDDEIEDAFQIYSQNKGKLFESVGIANDNVSFENSLLYFGIDWDNQEDPVVQALQNDLREKIAGEEQSAEENAPNENNYHVSLAQDNEIPISIYNNRDAVNLRNGTGAYTGERGQNEPSRKRGDWAEQEVYNLICNHQIAQVEEIVGNYTADGDHVKWISGAAHRQRNLQANDSEGYDMEVIGDKGSLYIEVKSSVGEACSFFMSENEKQKAKAYPERYAVVFVGSVNSQNPVARFIGNPTVNNRFVFTPLKYHVDFTAEQQV